MATLIDCAETLNCATLSGSNNVNVDFQAGVPNKIVVSLSQSVVGLSNLEVTGAIKAKNIQLSNSGGYSYLEIGAPVGAYIDLKNPESDDFDLRIISDSAPAGGGYLQAAGGAILALSGSNVGIGTKSPSADLDIRANGFNNLDMISAGASAGSYVSMKRSRGTIDSRTISSNNDYVGGYLFYGYDGDQDVILGGMYGIVNGAPSDNDMPGALAFSTTADGASGVTERMIIDAAGNVGIGTSTPGYKLTVTGSIAASNLLGGATTLSVDATGQIIRTPSDERLKENIQSLTGSLELITLMNPVRFNWKNKELFGDKKDIGLIAQEVKEIFPEVVSTDNDGTYGLDYTRLVPVLVDGVKQLKQENDDLKKILNDALTRISALENK
jgi:hypothetical protein